MASAHSPSSASAAADAEERLACAVLAAQVLALREEFRVVALSDQIWTASETLTRLADPAAAVDAATLEQVARMLETHAFLQAQSFDRASQMADTVATGLRALAASERPPGARLAALDLLGLYVCEEQRRVHDAVVNPMPDSPRETS
ncbi:hypothetical protein HB662_16075 [Roseomonas frigidaquae]|uniref:Uncharacterized protein n=1 Tax=Falsiroseomonas frigidaquae TaxID=487318 RepID=A0ABX1F1T5_9PROT|nr:hypothetical protein [Falsiroseomonas frigidaquae]NKE46305.1 hypothetical protein [Falsiroseomonas frigidaquae]